jgi:hypothetical protein
MRFGCVRGCFRWRLGSSAEDALERKTGFRTRTLSEADWYGSCEGSRALQRVDCCVDSGRLWQLSESTPAEAISEGRSRPQLALFNARAAHTSSAVFALPGAAIILRGEQLHNWIKAAVHELPSRAG